MGKARRVMRCYCCGAVLQSKNKEEEGFIEKELLKLEDANERVLYCHNCYEKMKAINTGMLESDTDDEILRILNDAVATDALLIWVVDLFQFNGTLNPEVVKKAKKLDVVVLGTKYDLFPKRIKPETMCSFLRDRFNEVGIDPVAVKVFGNTENIDPKDLLKKMEILRKGHDVYMVGTLASGKTSIINRLLKGYTNKSKRTIATEEYPGTSVKVLEIPLSNSSFFYELPGFSLNTSVLGKVEKEVKNIILPKKEIKMQKLVINEGDTMCVGSLAAFTLVKGRVTTFHFYGAEGNEVKRVSTKKLSRFLKENCVKRNLRPVSERFSAFTDYDVFEYDMERDGKEHDIAITGLGWMRFEGRGQVIRVTFPRGVAIKETLSKIEH